MKKRTFSTDKIFVAINIGSRSKKYAIYSNNEEITSITINQDSNKDQKISKNIKTQNKQFSIHNFLKQTMSVTGFEINQKTKIIFGIRIVAPGTFFTKHQVINQRFIEKLEKVKEFAPLHISPTIEEIKAIKKEFPKSKMIAISDSAFHQTRPLVTMHTGLPIKISKKYDFYNFGYHGLAHSSAINQLKSKKILRPKTVICHLGGGSSVTAIKGSKSLDTTMNFSPLSGIMGVTRSGTIDPTVINYLQKNDIANLQNLYQDSGFLGLTGSADIPEIIQKSKEKNSKINQKEKDAVELYCYQVQKAIGSSIAVLGGVDMIVFTGGIGVGSEHIRSKICKNFNYLGLKLDLKSNRHHFPGLISDRSSKVKVALIHIDEMQEIANICNKF